MNMFARFDENPAKTIDDIKETKRYGRTDTRTHARTDNVKTVYPPQAKFAGGIITCTFFAFSLYNMPFCTPPYLLFYQRYSSGNIQTEHVFGFAII